MQGRLLRLSVAALDARKSAYTPGQNYPRRSERGCTFPGTSPGTAPGLWSWKPGRAKNDVHTGRHTSNWPYRGRTARHPQPLEAWYRSQLRSPVMPDVRIGPGRSRPRARLAMGVKRGYSRWWKWSVHVFENRTGFRRCHPGKALVLSSGREG